MPILSILWARTKATILERGMNAAKPVSPPTQALVRARGALAQSDRLTPSVAAHRCLQVGSSAASAARSRLRRSRRTGRSGVGCRSAASVSMRSCSEIVVRESQSRAVV